MRRFAAFPVVLSLLGTGRVVAAAENESCDVAIEVEAGTPIESSSAQNTEVQPATVCGVEDVYALWYAFEAPVDGQFVFTTEGSADLVDTTVAVFDSCSADSVILCNDDALSSVAGRVELHMVEGQRVLVRVAGWGATRGDFRLAVDEFGAFDRPPNDACEDAILVTKKEPGTARTLNATGEDLSSCGAEDSVDIWYRFVAPADGSYDFGITQNMTSAHFVAVYDGCGGEELACGFLGTSAALATGDEVLVRVGTNPSVSDQFNLVVGPPPVTSPPPNDTHEGAIVVEVPSNTVGSTVGASKDALNFGPVCGPFVNAAIWYSFTAPDTDVYVFDTNGSELSDTIVAVFEDCETNGSTVPPLLACDQSFGAGEHGRLDALLEAGASICIAVGGNLLSEEGGVTLNVSRLGEPPDNDTCEAAAPITIDSLVTQENYTSTPVEVTTTCPLGSFPLWFSFTAPEYGHYKVDAKASLETSPDIAVYTECGTEEPLACSIDPKPAVDMELDAGQTVFIRASTDVYWRSEMVIRVGPRRDEAGQGGSGQGGATGAGGGGSGAGGAPDGTGGTTADDGAAPDQDGCNCTTAGGAPAGPFSSWALALLAAASLRRARRRVVAHPARSD